MFIHLLWFLAASGVVYFLYYLSLHFQKDYLRITWFYWLNGLFPARGQDLIFSPLLIIFFVGSAQFLVTLVSCFRSQIIAAGSPSWTELALTALVVVLAPLYNFALLLPIPVGLILYDVLIHWLNIWPGADWITSEHVTHWSSIDIAIIIIIEFIILLLITVGAFLVVRISRVAYSSFFKRIACIAAYFVMIHSGSAAFIGIGGFII